MQTFLPYASFARSARMLDPRRLGKQRVEVLQILRALEVEDYGWQRHPAVLMWRGYTEALVSYGVAIVTEWTRRGFRDACLASIAEFAPRARSQRELADAGALPPWLGARALHRSHRSALVRKDPAYYRPLFPGVPDDLPYVWPAPDHEVPPRAPFSSWVARVHDVDRARDEGTVALPRIELGKRPTSKAARQVRAFIDDVRSGDPIALVAGAELIAGEIVGDYELRDDEHVRAVCWLGPFSRGALAVPARLQDPRRFFALRGERDPRELVSGAGARRGSASARSRRSASRASRSASRSRGHR